MVVSGTFQEKPKNVEAQLFAGESSDLLAVVEWVKQNGYVWVDPFMPLPNRGVTFEETTGFLIVNTPEGPRKAEIGNWLVKHADGHIRPWSSYEFDKTFVSSEIVAEAKAVEVAQANTALQEMAVAIVSAAVRPEALTMAPSVDILIQPDVVEKSVSELPPIDPVFEVGPVVETPSEPDSVEVSLDEPLPFEDGV